MTAGKRITDQTRFFMQGLKKLYGMRQRRILLLTLFALTLALLIWCGWLYLAHANAPAKGHSSSRLDSAQVQTVRVAHVTRGAMPIELNALGTVTPLASFTAKTQVAGRLMKVSFKEGQFVQKGNLLAQIDPRPHQINLQNAQGVLAKDQALLKQAQADLKRYQILLKQDSISAKQVADQASLVEQYRGIVQADRAQVDQYQLNLTYCRITSPINGRVGLRQVDVGNYVQPSDANGIVVITQMQPTSVIFSLPEDTLPTVLKRLRSTQKLPVSAYDRNRSTVLETGYLKTIDNQIDPATGTVKLRAHFANQNDMLYPNQFVNINLLVDTLDGVTIVPSSAIQNGSIGTYAYVINPDNTVSVRTLKTGPVKAEYTSIKTGLTPGERVVIDGADRLREGTKIAVAPSQPA
ncbi:MAG: membrane fusion protein, multidrug efflux system [Glomeribacter sp. 1016415]|nr:membrane fusion protein, multidrug efflux system [Glomeribacter sp. 1016415]